MILLLYFGTITTMDFFLLFHFILSQYCLEIHVFIVIQI